MRIFILLCMAVVLGACANTSVGAERPEVEKKEDPKLGINGLEITYKRAFDHNRNGVTVMMNITNNTGYDVQITEEKNLISNVSGFVLHHENSYSVKGGILKNGETKNNETLLYFHDRNIANMLEWVTPAFEVVIDGKTHNITGKKMMIE